MATERVPTLDGSDNLPIAFIPTGTTSSTVATGDLPGAVKTTGGGREAIAAVTATTTSRTLDLASGNVQTLTLASDITTLTLTGATASTACSLTLYIVQDGTGGRTITWPASVKWPGGADPTLSAAAGAEDLVVLETRDGGNRWIANLAGLDYK